jgi:hypothetical protein
MKQKASNRGKPVSAAVAKLADWRVYLTNVPKEMLNLEEVLVLYRARWQIELLFKLWKKEGLVDEWRSEKPWRIMCEVYAKLIGVVIQHWNLLLSGWRYGDNSLVEAAQTYRKAVWGLAKVFGQVSRLKEIIEDLAECLAAGCKLNKRGQAPATYQLLNNPETFLP